MDQSSSFEGVGGSYSGNGSNGFALLVVLFILLIIVGSQYFNNNKGYY
ncbi:YjcZ family sporulation protein [Lysinibacillus yapensis]|uniref:YjcZ family sporulation protein n=1 Tax=Ureibacillus yapensis TaxID=2304605 RepID=A0A396SGS9_9BACL|nr:YjcZ family sporulation protein [Lysinibacillus yapensis]RHW38277.1 YjcZ family sporulation protein [Lysinibacillus yapensis]